MRPPEPSVLPRRAAAAAALLLCLAVGCWGPVGERALLLPVLGPVPGAFLMLFALLWAASILLLVAHPRGLSFRDSAVRILLLALAARLLVFGHPPSDDVYRYLWEGRLLGGGISPYGLPPDDPSLAALAGTDPFWPSINHPDMSAAYPPVLLALFAVAGKAAYHPASLKALAAAADLATVAVILTLLARRGLSARWAILYAFNPVVLVAFAGQGHFDALQNLCVAAGIALWDRKRWRAMFVALALAVQIKYVALAAVPFFLRRENLRHLWIGVCCALLPLAPFLWRDGAGVFNSLFQFGIEFAFNGPVHGLLRWVFAGAIAPATGVCAVLLAAALAVGLRLFHPALSKRFAGDPVSGVLFAFGALLVCSPTVHFWYLTWALFLLPLRPSLSWLVLSLTAAAVFVTDAVWAATGQWRLPAWAFGVEWGPFLLLLAVEGRRLLLRFRAPVPDDTPETVSVVIPAKNEAAFIAGTVRAARGDDAVCEVIVVDGGSSDGTRVRAAGAGARVLLHRRPPESGGGRGGQIRRGVRRARGSVIAVVHADTVVGRPAFTRMCTVLRCQPMVAGGTLGGGLDNGRWPLWLVDWANDLRAAFFGIGFGDQVQFFRRQPVVDGDLFPDIPLMEDVEMSLRLQRLGRVVHLFGDARISGRRWRSRSGRRTMLVLRLFFSYLFGRAFSRPDAAALYRRYYQNRFPGRSSSADRL